jgi:hypothetical protein
VHICMFAYSGTKENRKAGLKIKKTLSEKNGPKCSFTYLCICFRGKEITASGCDFFKQIEFAEEHLKTSALGQHFLYFFVYLCDFVASASLANGKTNTIELQ